MARGTIFDELETRWGQDRTVRHCPPAWQGETELAGWTPYELVSRDRSQTDPPAARQALAALVRRAHDDDLAAATALQILLPNAKALLSRVARLPGSAEERAQAVVEALWERIRCYPCQRAGSVIGNISADLIKALVADRDGHTRTRGAAASALGRREWRHPTSVTASEALDGVDDIVDNTAMAAGAELLALLSQAVAAGDLDPAAAALIGRYRIADVSADELARQQGLKAQSVRRNRQRAEQQFIAAAA